MKMYYWASGALCAFQCIVLWDMHAETSLLITGCVAAVLSVLVSASPMFDLHNVIRSRSARCWPQDLIFASFFSGLLWISCGVMLNDLWILVPNIVGFFMGAIQLGIIYKYSDSEERKPLVKEKNAGFMNSLGESAKLTKSEEELACTGGTGGT